MKSITIKAPVDYDCDMREWSAAYSVEGNNEVRLLAIESRSAIEVVVAKIIKNNLLGTYAEYYVSSPNFGVAIPGISSLLETHWIMEKLVYADMPPSDAVTIAQTLQDMGDF